MRAVGGQCDGRLESGQMRTRTACHVRLGEIGSALEVELSARKSEQTILYRHLLAKTTTATERWQLMMRLLRLHLARGWVRAVVGAYLYAKAQKEMEHSHA